MLSIYPIWEEAWKAREKTSLMRDASNTARTTLAAQRIFFNISRVIGHLIMGVDALVPAVLTTFLTQNVAVGSSSSTSLCLQLKVYMYVLIVALSWSTESMYATNMATLSGTGTPFYSFTC